MIARAVVLLTAAALLAPAAAAARFTADDRETLLVSTAADGGFPNGASRAGAFSQDRQRASYAAYESDATNIVAGDANGVTDVFLVTNARPSLSGPAWRRGATRLVSRAHDGGPANGPSSAPDLGGDQIHAPRCIAFVSAASNLVRGDTNGKPDAFVQDLRTRRTTRVSVATGGAQSDGTTYEVEVDGSCTRVAFVADAGNLALTRAQGVRRGLRTTAAPRGTKQVYVRFLGSRGPNRALGGTTFLASATGGERGRRRAVVLQARRRARLHARVRRHRW